VGGKREEREGPHGTSRTYRIPDLMSRTEIWDLAFRREKAVSDRNFSSSGCWNGIWSSWFPCHGLIYKKAIQICVA